LQGGFAIGAKFVDSVRSHLLQSCGELKDIAVSVADSISPPDFALNSVIGKSDGMVFIDLYY